MSQLIDKYQLFKQHLDTLPEVPVGKFFSIKYRTESGMSKIHEGCILRRKKVSKAGKEFYFTFIVFVFKI